MVVTERTQVVTAFGAKYRYGDVEVYYPSPHGAVEAPLA